MIFCGDPAGDNGGDVGDDFILIWLTDNLESDDADEAAARPAFSSIGLALWPAAPSFVRDAIMLFNCAVAASIGVTSSFLVTNWLLTMVAAGAFWPLPNADGTIFRCTISGGCRPLAIDTLAALLATPAAAPLVSTRTYCTPLPATLTARICEVAFNLTMFCVFALAADDWMSTGLPPSIDFTHLFNMVGG